MKLGLDGASALLTGASKGIDQVHERWGHMASQVSSSDLATTPVLGSRGLERDPDYIPRYRPAPEREFLAVEVADDDADLLRGLIATGLHGNTEGEAVRAAFMRWCNRHVTRIRRPYVQYTAAD